MSAAWASQHRCRRHRTAATSGRACLVRVRVRVRGRVRVGVGVGVGVRVRVSLVAIVQAPAYPPKEALTHVGSAGQPAPVLEASHSSDVWSGLPG